MFNIEGLSCLAADAAILQNGSLLPAGEEGQEVPAKLEDEAYGQFEDFFDATEAKAMATVLSTMMSPGIGLACLDDRLHARGRILWQQKVSRYSGRRSTTFLLLSENFHQVFNVTLAL